jgi:hypothetical protein
MIRATINPADLENLATKPGLLVKVVTAKVQRFVLLLQQKIKREKLQGQVLQHRTGKLDRSIIALPVEVDGAVVTGEVQGAGPPAQYGQIQEAGGSRSYTIVPVNKKALMFIGTGGAKAFAKKVEHPALKQRSFMSSSLDGMQAQIVSELQETQV